MTAPHDPFRLLFVCTANRCRSPMAEVIGAAQLRRRGVDAVVVSCGVLDGGVQVSPGAVRAVARRGLDLSGRLSHQLDSDTVDAADLIVAMERRHLTSVAELSVPAVERSFTLLELADLSVVVGPRRSGQSLPAWIQAAHRMRLPSAVLSTNEDSDLADPMGGSSRAYRRTADEIELRLGAIFDAMFPSTSTADASGPTTA